MNNTYQKKKKLNLILVNLPQIFVYLKICSLKVLAEFERQQWEKTVREEEYVSVALIVVAYTCIYLYTSCLLSDVLYH